MKTNLYNLTALAVLLLAGSAIQAQSKIKDGSVTTTSSLPNSNAVLELESNHKGFLLPRVPLDSTTSMAPLTAHVAGMTVYNTATAGTSPNDVTPGYYYDDGAQWVRLGTSDIWKKNTSNSSITTAQKSDGNPRATGTDLIITDDGHFSVRTPNVTNAYFQFNDSFPSWGSNLNVSTPSFSPAISSNGAVEIYRGVTNSSDLWLSTDANYLDGYLNLSLGDNGVTTLSNYRGGDYESQIQMGFETATGSGTGFLAFYTGPTSATPKMKLDPQGKLGIGTTIPTSPLHVTGIPAYDNDAAAGTGGLTAGAFWQTSATNTLSLPVGVLMVKQ